MTDLSSDIYFIGVRPARDPFGTIYPDRVVAALIKAGCEDIEVLDHGTAQARVPADWLDDLEREGSVTREVEAGGERFVIEVDLP